MLKKVDTKLYFIYQAEECDLKASELDLSLNKAGFDEKNSAFWCSFDYFHHQNFIDFVDKILKAHGYEINCENMLFSLETIWFGYLVELSSEGALENPVAKKHLPALLFHLPMKSKAKKLLQLYYRDIKEAIEGADQDGKQNSQDAAEKLQERIKELEHEQQVLRHQLAGKKSGAKHFMVGSGVGEGVRSARVQRINFSERHVLLRADRKQFTAPFAILRGLPKEEARCLVKIHSDQSLVEPIFADVDLWELRRVPARVLARDGNLLKVKAGDQGYWQFKALNTWEEEALRGVEVGDQGILSFVGDELIHFRFAADREPRRLALDLAEELVKQQKA